MTLILKNAAYDDLVRAILWLDRSLELLPSMVSPMGIAPLAGTEWYSLLRKKLVPQLARRSHLVVAVTGGTNTGKSVIFNLLAGENASAADIYAAGTKHPVCLLPVGIEPNEILRQYFGTFEHLRWRNANDPLTAAPEHRLYWNIGRNVPERLLIVDAPDVDSDAEVNWERARDVRQVADLLIAVLTAQKYNDAAVKQYFREAAEAGKPVILVWNMAYHEQYRGVWAEWNRQFRHETGVKPLAVFAAPHDRQAAENRTLPIYDLGVEGRGAEQQSEPLAALRDYLNQTRFEELKMQALFGAVRRVDAKDSGAGAYLEQIANTAKDFARAAETIRERQNWTVEWPAIPKAMLAGEIGRWCNKRRPEFLQNVNAAYETVLRPALWAWGSVRNRWTSKRQRAEQNEEHKAVLSLVEKAIEQLKALAESSSNTVLRNELGDYLGSRRKRILEAAERIHSQIPQNTDEYIRREIEESLDRWAKENPEQWRRLHKLDVAAFGTHAVLSVGALATCGVFGAGMMANVSGALPYFLTVGGVTGGSETILKILGEEIRLKIAEIKVEIQQKYAAWRRGIFLERFESELWGEMLRKFDHFAAIPQSREYLDAIQALEAVRKIAEEK
ncbi:MAG: 50S ribosome-binding GTPase [Planctomycetaceae bacterium]|jgi:hypothetical protein|nr:50S ribosome-binding GTPase [Planctomycetaceae bacterium]